MNNTNNNNNVNREAESNQLIKNSNNKFHAQKYVTIPKINVFKKSENDLKLPTAIQKKLRPQSNSLSQQSIPDNKRSSNSPITSSGSKSLKEPRRRSNKNFRKPSRGESTSSNRGSTPVMKKPRLDQKQSTSLVTVPPSPSSESDDLIHQQPAQVCLQQNLSLPLKQRTVPRLPPTAQSHCSHDSRHNKSPTRQSSVLKTSSDSPNNLTKSQTPEQQLEIMKYWLDEYYKHNRFDPTISDLTSGKPWNEIEGKLLSQFMPIFKRYLSDNSVNTRTAEFYSLFFAALKDKHKLPEIPYDD